MSKLLFLIYRYFTVLTALLLQFINFLRTLINEVLLKNYVIQNII